MYRSNKSNKSNKSNTLNNDPDSNLFPSLFDAEYEYYAKRLPVALQQAQQLQPQAQQPKPRAQQPQPRAQQPQPRAQQPQPRAQQPQPRAQQPQAPQLQEQFEEELEQNLEVDQEGQEENHEENPQTAQIAPLPDLTNFYAISNKLKNLPNFNSELKKHDAINSLKETNATSSFMVIKDHELNEKIKEKQTKDTEDANLANYLFICKINDGWIFLFPFSFALDGISILLTTAILTFNMVANEYADPADDNLIAFMKILNSNIENFLKLLELNRKSLKLTQAKNTTLEKESASTEEDKKSDLKKKESPSISPYNKVSMFKDPGINPMIQHEFYAFNFYKTDSIQEALSIYKERTQQQLWYKTSYIIFPDSQNNKNIFYLYANTKEHYELEQPIMFICNFNSKNKNWEYASYDHKITTTDWNKFLKELQEKYDFSLKKEEIDNIKLFI